MLDPVGDQGLEPLRDNLPLIQIDEQGWDRLGEASRRVFRPIGPLGQRPPFVLPGSNACRVMTALLISTRPSSYPNAPATTFAMP